MAIIANYVLYLEIFLRIWISFLFQVRISSYECRARCVTLESEMERSYVHRYLRTVMLITSEWKEIEKFSFFIMGIAWILTGLGKLTKREHKLWGPHNGVQVKKILKIVFKNVSCLHPFLQNLFYWITRIISWFVFARYGARVI